MKDIVRDYQEKFRRSRKHLRRYTALLLALALTTTLFVNWQLHSVGIAKTADYLCGLEEHEHTADCYPKVLVCGYEEGQPEDGTATLPSSDTTLDESFGVDAAADTGSTASAAAELSSEPEYIFVPHEHTDDCYQEVKTLTCYEEEHEHTDDCFSPEDGSLICDKFPHTHDDSCYTTEYELVCGYEEGELVEEPNPDYVAPDETAFAVFDSPAVVLPAASLQPVVVSSDSTDAPVHHHTSACYAVDYDAEPICGLEEHHHTVNCLADPQVDPETEEEWQAKANVVLENVWSADLLAVAESQLGYTPSEKNFRLDDADGETVHYYSRYGADYGNPYGEWDVMFLAYCLKHADIPQSSIPQRAGVDALHSDLRSAMVDPLTGQGYAADYNGDLPYRATAPGDIVIYNGSIAQYTYVPSQTLRVEDTSADADAMLLALDPLETQPYIRQSTMYTSTVGIVKDVDTATGTLTVISGNVDGKVAEVTVNASDVTTLVSVASAQAAADGTSTMDDAETVSYSGQFTAVDTNGVETIVAKGGITSASVKVDGTDKTGQKVDLASGKKVDFSYSYAFPANAIPKGTKKLTYKLPEGLVLTPEQAAASKTNITQKIGDKTITVGTMSIAEDGTVTLEFNDNLDTTQPFDGTFLFSATTSYVGEDDSTTITIPGGSSSTDTTITVAKPTDLGIKKTGKVDDTQKDALYIDYTVTVSSEKGWNDLINIWDELQDKTLDGEFVTNSFVLKKTGETDALNYTPTFSDSNTKFEYKDLPALKAGESYTLTYKVKLPKGLNQDFDYVNVVHTDNNQYVWNTTKLYSHISKKGSYDSTTDRIKWVITVNNPYGGSLKDYTVTDALETAGAQIVGNIELTATDQYGNWTDWKKTLKPSDYAREDGKEGFTFTFSNDMVSDSGKTNDATSKNYYFTYYTDAPKDANGNVQPIKNDSELDTPDNGPKYPASDTVTPADRNYSVDSKSSTGSLTATDTENLYTHAWTVKNTLPNAKGTYTFTDFIIKPDAGDHYSTIAELEKTLQANLVLTLTDGTTLQYSDLAANGLKLTVEYYADYEETGSTRTPKGDPLPAGSTEKVRCFKVTLDTTGYTGTINTKALTLQYNTFVDTTGMKPGTTYNVKNYANDKGGSFDYKPTDNSVTFGKYVSNDQRNAFTGHYNLPSSQASDDYNGNPGTYYSGSLDEIYLSDFTKSLTAEYADSQYLYYQLRLDFTATDTIPQDNYTFTDTLPKGLEFDTDYTPQAIMDLNGWWAKKAKTPATPYTDSPFLNDSAHFSYSDITTSSTGGQQRTFTLNGLQDISAYQQGELRYIVIIYRVKLADNSFWKLPTSTERHYINTVASDSFPDSSADVDITRNTKSLEKHAAFVKDDANKELRIKYQVEINKGAEDLLAGLDSTDGMVTLTDTITTKTNIHLDTASVHLYDYPYIEGLSTPLDPLQYELHYSKPAEGSTAPYTHTITLKVPNQHGYVLVYDYLVDDVVNVNTTITNNAELTGADSTHTDTAVTGFTSAATANQASITLYKVDSLNDLTRLPDAHFTLSKFDKDSGAFVDVGNPLETDAEGKITIFRDKNFDGLQNDVLYRLEETQAPDGYATPTDGSQYVYFVWANQNQTPDAAWEAAIGSNAPGTGALPEKERVQLLNNNGNVTVSMANTRTYLTLKKFWQDEYGQEMNGTTVEPDEIEVKLYRYKDGEEVRDPATNQLVDTITLKKTPTLDVDGTTTPWTYVVKDVKQGYRHYIVEATSNKLYDVTYSASNTAGVTGGGLLTLTNRIHKEYGKLTLNKLWLNASGEDVTASTELSATFTLTRHTTQNGKTTDTVVDTVALNAKNNFTYTWDRLEKGENITYTLTEERVDGYTASYTFNGETLSGSFSLTGNGDGDTVTVTNTPGSAGYELPSTGGAGTIPYTAGGAALMLAALVCGACKKRRREGRAD